MLRMSDVDSMYIAEHLSGFAKRMVEDGIVPRQVDLLLLGFAYGVRNRLAIPERPKRHDLLRAGALDQDIRLVVEAVATWYARQVGADVPTDAKGLLDLVCRLGSAGADTLKKQWEGRAKSQIELAILQLAKPVERPSEPGAATR